MIGDYNWGLKTRGNLNLMAKIYFTYQAIKQKGIPKINMLPLLYIEKVI
jgi:hypothetical protein